MDLAGGYVLSLFLRSKFSTTESDAPRCRFITGAQSRTPMGCNQVGLLALKFSLGKISAAIGPFYCLRASPVA